MTPQESQALQTLLSQLAEVRGIEKDPEADAMIRAAAARQPDAVYLLAQRSLILEQAVESAKQRIAALERQVATAGTASGGRSFLDANAWGRSGAAPTGSTAPAYAPPVPDYNRQGMQRTQGGFMRGGSPGMFGGGGSFLGSMAATAAGVAGGAFLFHGLSGLFDGDDPAQASNLADDGAASGGLDQAAVSEPDALADDAGLNDVAGASDYAVDDGFVDDGGLGDDSSFG